MSINILGNWSLVLNSPHLSNGTGTSGDTFVINGTGTYNYFGTSILYENGRLLSYNGSVWVYQGNDSGGTIDTGIGTVTSVDLAVPSWYSVSNNPITTSGTISINPNPTLLPGLVLATPPTNVGPLSLRSISSSDLPNILSTPGIFVNPTITVNSKGLITSVGSGTGGTVLPANQGGTGFGSYNIGDILYANSTSTLAKLPIGSIGNVLGSNGTTPFWTTTGSGTGTVTSIVISAPLTGGTITTTGTIGITQSNTSTSGYLSPTDWNTFNNKQNVLSGIGIVKSVSGTISYINGTSSQFVKGNGSLDSSTYLTANQSIVLTGDVTGTGTTSITTIIANNAVSYAKMQNISTTSKLLGSSSTTTPVQEITLGTGLSMSGTTLSSTGTGGTVTSVGIGVPSIFNVSGSPITGLGTITITLANESANLVFSGPTSGSSATPTFRSLVFNDIPSVVNQTLTGYSSTSGTISSSTTIVQSIGFLNAAVSALIGAVIYQGLWNANTNSPTLTSSVGVQGHYYVVSVAGTTTLDGLSSWNVGDAVIFNGSVWQKLDGTATEVLSVNGLIGAVPLTGTSNRITISGSNVFDISVSYIGQSSITTVGTLTSGSYTATPIVSAYISSLTGGQVGISGLSATGSASSTTFLRGDNTWSVPVGTTYTGTAPIIITGTVISSTQSTTSTNGYLSSTDWNTFNGKMNNLIPTAIQTSNYSANIQDFVICDTTSGSFTITLPTVPIDKGRVGAKMVIQGSTNIITIQCGGSDVINRSGGSTSTILKISSQGIILQYKSSTAIWYIISDDLPLAQLDLRYAPISIVGTVTSVSGTTNQIGSTGGATPIISIVSSAILPGSPTVASPGTSTGSIVSIDGTQTLSNKRITERIGTETSSNASAINSDAYDQWNITALAVADTISAPSGTPTDGQSLIIRIKDNGTARALSFNSIFRFSSDLTAPTTTIISKTLYLGFKWNAADSKWDNLAQLNNFS